MGEWRVGIDIGGTFTDVVAVETETGALVVTKVPSVPSDPARAVVDGVRRLAGDDPPVPPGEVAFFAHGTTVATNALLELRGATAGLLINRGFRALYELRGGTRPSGSDLIDTFYQKPAVLVPQRRTAEVGGRVGWDGAELEPLDEDGVRVAVRHLRSQGVESIAVCYLFSFLRPAHERRTAEIIAEEHPGCRVSLSSEVLPVIREYQRISTTVLDAYVGPVVSSYLERLAAGLRDCGLATEQLFVMQSDGGLMRIEVAARHPNQTLLSGPAAGVIFGAGVAERTGERGVATFDMGGTSTDLAVLPGTEAQETRQGSVGGQDVGTPMIEIRTLGAGGGTIAAIGPDGLLQVGPRSAGAVPGPACYGLGGEEPTVTDASLVLGHLAPDGFAGGLRLEPDLARRAIMEKVARPLGIELEEAALGIHRVLHATMAAGLRLSLLERGLDHRQFALVAFGGAGPMHAGRLARDAGIPRVLVPTHPGVSCALGLLQTDVRHTYLRSRLAPLDALPEAELEALFAELEERAGAEAREEGRAGLPLSLTRQLDLRYPHQGYELTVPGARDRDTVARAFHRLHQDVYGISAPEEVPEVVNVRVTSVSPVPRLRQAEVPEGDPATRAARALTGRRAVRFEGCEVRVETPVYRRDALLAGDACEGPAIVEQPDATAVVLPGQRATVLASGTLRLDVDLEVER